MEARLVLVKIERGLAERRRVGRLLGALFVVGALATLPASLLLEPQPPLSIYGLTLLGVVSGIACYLAPWDRLPSGALVLPTRWRIAVQIGLAAVALFACAARDAIEQDDLRIALLWVPVLMIVAGAVRYLREQIENREQAELEFAREADRIAGRIRGARFR